MNTCASHHAFYSGRESEGESERVRQSERERERERKQARERERERERRRQSERETLRLSERERERGRRILVPFADAVLELRLVHEVLHLQSGVHHSVFAVRDLGTTTLHKSAVVPRRARCKAHRLVYHSTLGLRVVKKNKQDPRAEVVSETLHYES